MRNLQARRGQAGDFRQRVEHLLERQVFAAEEIALADFAFFGDEQMSGGAFFDADEIETGVDVAGHFAVQKIDDDFTGGRGLPVPRADRRGGHRNDDRQAFLAAFSASRSAIHFERL